MAEGLGQSFLERHYYFFRRLHSLTGIVPIGAFLIPHLTTNSAIVWGQWLNPSHFESGGHAGVETFQHEVNFIHSLPFLVLIEIFLLWLPIAYHAIMGIYYATTGHSNVRHYGYQENWRYLWQRISGYVGVVFIFLHIASLRWGWTFGGLFPGFDYDHAASSTAVHFQSGTSFRVFVVTAFYVVAVLLLVFHFANGLWTAGITWGLTVTENAQRKWGYVCAGVGGALAAATIAAVFGFVTLDAEHAKVVENMMLETPGVDQRPMHDVDDEGAEQSSSDSHGRGDVAGSMTGTGH